MATMSCEEQMVEHVVLFKVKPDADPGKVAAWVNGLNGLTSLHLTLHLSAGQLLRCRSTSSLTFTHMLHSRYRSKGHLRRYAVHPEHLRVVTEGKSILDDVMSLDWMTSNAAVCFKPGSAMRVGFYKLMEGLGETEKARVLEVIMGGIAGNDELKSAGESFCDDRAKGYTIASIAVFPNPPPPPPAADLDSNDSGDLLLPKEGVMKNSIQSVVLVDYVIPSP